MSKGLPLWNKSETDVLPQYRLTFGHVICQAEMARETVEELAKHLDIGAVEYAGDADSARIPVEPRSGCHVLRRGRETHLLVAEVGGNWVVFGPHKLFGSSARWIDWNTNCGGLMSYVTQLDVEDYFHNIFRNGTRMMYVSAEGSGLRFIEESPIEVYLSGKRVYHDPGGRPEPTAEIYALLESDARIMEKDGAVSIRAFTEDRSVERVTHYIFTMPADEYAMPTGSKENKPEGFLGVLRQRLGLP